MASEISLDLAQLENVKHLCGGGIRAACPACRASGSDKSGDHLLIQQGGKFGCAANPGDSEHRKEIFRLAGNPKSSPAAKPQIVATYDYHDASGKVVFQIVRYQPKDFRQRRPDGKGGWIWNMAGVEKVLFRLPEIAHAIAAGKVIFLTEGEKDTLAMVQHGFDATCNPGGAVKKADGKKWLETYTEALRGADVCIIADKDGDGRKHTQIVAGKLHGVASSVRVIELPDTNGKPVKDAADFFAAGGTKKTIGELVDNVPTWTPQAAQLATVPTTKTESTSDADTFDKITSDVRGDILGKMGDKNTAPSAQRREICGRVIAALNRVGRFYFHADLRDYESALFFNRFTKRLERLRADAFTSWLSEWLCVNRADALFRFIISAVETESLSGEQTTGILPESFWSSRPGAIYISNGDGQLVKITAAGVNLVDNGSDGVLFPVGRTCQPWQLVPPKDIFQTCGIFRDVHAVAGHAPDLLRAWIYSLPSNPKSKPPLCLTGEIGSGKTRLVKAIAEFYGLPFNAAKVEESEESNFWPSVDAGGIFTLDNADTKCRWLADALANAATDGCSQRRRLYTNAEIITLRPRAWLAVTTANPTFAADSGLADRLLLVRMARRDNEDTSDAALTDEISANRDAGLSHLAETLRAALADTEPTQSGLNRRHPDFAAFAVRIGRALNRKTEVIAALKHAEADKSAFCLENDHIATVLLTYLRTVESFTGTANDLAPKLVEIDAELSAIKPLSARKLGKRLTAIWPHLQSTLATASREPDRKGFTVFRFKSAEYAEFQKPIP